MATLKSLGDEAESVAMEHIRWALGNGMSLTDIARSLGRTPRPDDGFDDIFTMVTSAWLMVCRVPPKAVENNRTNVRATMKKRRNSAVCNSVNPLRVE